MAHEKSCSDDIENSPLYQLAVNYFGRYHVDANSKIGGLTVKGNGKSNINITPTYISYDDSNQTSDVLDFTNLCRQRLGIELKVECSKL